MTTQKKVAIVQSSYIPWKGYFDLINGVDEFILYDDAQFTKRDWRSRNKIKTPQGDLWLSIPIDVKGKFTQAIKEAQVSDQKWRRKHWQSICASYGKAPFFNDYAKSFEALFVESEEGNLSKINRSFIEAICATLGITTKISFSMDYPFPPSSKTTQLVDLCCLAGATEYISGPAARVYLDESLFNAKGIAVSFYDYSNYPEYPQLHGPFTHEVSVLDLIFSVGAEANRYMKSFAGRGL